MKVIIATLLLGLCGWTAAADTANILSADEKQLGFEMIFDGQSLTGWEHQGNWSIEDGTLSRIAKGGSLTYTAKKVPDDFELRFDWKVAKGCNSGVYYRPGQYEYQLLDDANSPYGENPRQSAGSLFFCMAPSQKVVRPFDQWNEGRIVCKGSVLQHWLNGVKVIDFDYTDPRWAKEVELLRIRGGDLTARGANLSLQDHGAAVALRSLRWRVIPATEELQRTETIPQAISAAALKKEEERGRKMIEAAKLKKEPKPN